jgi:hypothetical protein
MLIERERNRESTRSASKFEDRATHPIREIAVEPLARPGLYYEIIEGRDVIQREMFHL